MTHKTLPLLALMAACLPLKVVAEENLATSTGATATAAQTFLATLTEVQRGKVAYDFKDAAQRKNWSNLPTSFVKRGGLRLGDLTQEQRDAAMAVVEAALSPEGYAKVEEIVEGDEMLKKNDKGGAPRSGQAGAGGAGAPPSGGAGGPGAPKGPGRPGGGGPPAFGHDEYYISFLGQPSTTEPWMIQFGGHHLAINITLAGAHGTLAPSHTAAQPARYEIEGKTVRPLGDETDKAHALLTSLTEAQRKQAILGFEMRDLVLGPGRDGQTIQPEGIKGANLTDKQRELLLDLASEWTGMQSADFAKAKMEEMKKNIEDTWFAWSGPVEKGGAAYFRIQGPTVLIEYAPQRLGGDPTNHIHTIYRDPTNDYGAQWWRP
ncbi:DUF3500 domain-containing protein [Prosthecobacter sp.]|uniref:DUF3500 domain-containing protein n=1 Tax=Prosthecobacter sp. TaxID=1965333 RepID=UPI003783165B